MGASAFKCPKHKKQSIYRMYCSLPARKKRVSKNSTIGKKKAYTRYPLHHQTDWFYCIKCKRAYFVEIKVTTK